MLPDDNQTRQAFLYIFFAARKIPSPRFEDLENGEPIHTGTLPGNSLRFEFTQVL